MEEFTERFPDVKEVIVDGTERPVQRPQNRERQKEYYSGKKKRHTCKQITVSTKKPKGIEARRHGGGMGQFL
nr:transposase family protein [Cylindrospermopsis raciborskii]